MSGLFGESGVEAAKVVRFLPGEDGAGEGGVGFGGHDVFFDIGGIEVEAGGWGAGVCYLFDSGSEGFVAMEKEDTR